MRVMCLLTIAQAKHARSVNNNQHVINNSHSISSNITSNKIIRQHVMQLLCQFKVKMLMSSSRQATQCCCTVRSRSSSPYTPHYCKIRCGAELDMNHHNHPTKRDLDAMWWRLLTIINLLVSYYHQPSCSVQWRCVKCFVHCSLCVKLMICLRKNTFVQTLCTTSCKRWSSSRVMLIWGRYNVQ